MCPTTALKRTGSDSLMHGTTCTYPVALLVQYRTEAQVRCIHADHVAQAQVPCTSACKGLPASPWTSLNPIPVPRTISLPLECIEFRNDTARKPVRRLGSLPLLSV
jgi:hypothetical protein